MGVDYNVYVGPYIRCQNPSIDMEVDEIGCPNCKVEMDTEFCPTCGSRSATFTAEIETVKVGYEDLDESFQTAGLLFGDSLICINEGQDDDIYIANQHGGPGINIDPRNDFGVLVDEVNSKKDIRKMESFLKKELVILRKLHGEDKVLIQWGVISYSS